MPPMESSASPAPQAGGQQPFPRRRLSVDGVSAAPIRRPIYNGRPQQLNRTPAPQPVASQNYPKVWNDVRQPAPVITQPPVVSQPPVALPQAPQTAEPENPTWIPQPTIAPQPTTATASPAVQAAPPKARRRLRISIRPKLVLIPLAVIVLVGLIGGGVYGFVHWRAVQANPATIFDNALQAAFSTAGVRSETDGGGDSQQLTLDLSSLKQPLVKVQQSQTIAGQVVQYAGYGSTANTYFSYTTLPATIPHNLSSVATNAWVQLRTNGKPASGISTQLSSLPDPRYQAFGLLPFANIPLDQRQQLINFVKSHNIYAYKQTAVSHTTIDGQAVTVYPVTINTSYLKILNQSIASMEGFTPTDVQAAVASLGSLANATLYVSTKTHQFVELAYSANNQPTTVSYNYGQIDTGQEPQTKLTWPSFSALEYQIEAQLSAGLSNADRDAIRQADLTAIHTALASYEATNGFYPTLANMNDQNWVTTNLNGLDPEVFRDPQATSLNLLDTPKAGNYAYQVVPDSGKGSCVNAGTDPCIHYTFIATLSTGQPAAVNDP